MLESIKERIRAIWARLNHQYPSSHISIKAKIGHNCTMEGKNWICDGVRLNNVYLGYGSYVSTGGQLFNIRIGRYTSVGPRCIVLSGGNHPTSRFVSTHPCFYSKDTHVGFTYSHQNLFNEYEYTDPENKYMVEVGNDVWIASDVKLLPGIVIHDGAVIAAGAVVTKDVPPYAIVGGVPAKVIRYRFEKEQIESLLDFQWWNKDEKWIREHAGLFDDIDGFLSHCIHANE